MNLLHFVKNNIDFFTSPYDLDYVDQLNKHICAYKIGSGECNNYPLIEHIAKFGTVSQFRNIIT